MEQAPAPKRRGRPPKNLQKSSTAGESSNQSTTHVPGPTQQPPAPPTRSLPKRKASAAASLIIKEVASNQQRHTRTASAEAPPIGSRIIVAGPEAVKEQEVSATGTPNSKVTSDNPSGRGVRATCANGLLIITGLGPEAWRKIKAESPEQQLSAIPGYDKKSSNDTSRTDPSQGDDSVRKPSETTGNGEAVAGDTAQTNPAKTSSNKKTGLTVTGRKRRPWNQEQHDAFHDRQLQRELRNVQFALAKQAMENTPVDSHATSASPEISADKSPDTNADHTISNTAKASVENGNAASLPMTANDGSSNSGSSSLSVNTRKRNVANTIMGPPTFKRPRARSDTYDRAKISESDLDDHQKKLKTLIDWARTRVSHGAFQEPVSYFGQTPSLEVLVKEEDTEHDRSQRARSLPLDLSQAVQMPEQPTVMDTLPTTQHKQDTRSTAQEERKCPLCGDGVGLVSLEAFRRHVERCSEDSPDSSSINEFVGDESSVSRIVSRSASAQVPAIGADPSAGHVSSSSLSNISEQPSLEAEEVLQPEKEISSGSRTDPDELIDDDFPSAYEEEDSSAETSPPASESIDPSRFKKITDFTRFITALEKPSSRSTNALYCVVENAAEVLKTWQDEWMALEKEVAHESQRPTIHPRPVQETVIFEDQKEATLYGYRWDPNPAKQGKQDAMSQRRLRGPGGREIRERRPSSKLLASETDEASSQPQPTGPRGRPLRATRLGLGLGNAGTDAMSEAVSSGIDGGSTHPNPAASDEVSKKRGRARMQQLLPHVMTESESTPAPTPAKRRGRPPKDASKAAPQQTVGKRKATDTAGTVGGDGPPTKRRGRPPKNASTASTPAPIASSMNSFGGDGAMDIDVISDDIDDALYRPSSYTNSKRKYQKKIPRPSSTRAQEAGITKRIGRPPGSRTKTTSTRGRGRGRGSRGGARGGRMFSSAARAKLEAALFEVDGARDGDAEDEGTPLPPPSTSSPTLMRTPTAPKTTTTLEHTPEERKMTEFEHYQLLASGGLQGPRGGRRRKREGGDGEGEAEEEEDGEEMM
ncbi:MAG: hypothetical protein M1817_002225 [Caeruleum heppii]|nr:MAG: hypothetical protein M1817_002225 [Caeruleum heppii]